MHCLAAPALPVPLPEPAACGGQGPLGQARDALWEQNGGRKEKPPSLFAQWRVKASARPDLGCPGVPCGRSCPLRVLFPGNARPPFWKAPAGCPEAL